MFSITYMENKRKIYMGIKGGKNPLMKILVCVCVLYKLLPPTLRFGTMQIINA